MDKTYSYKKTHWLISFEGKLIRAQVKVGETVLVGQELATVEEEAFGEIDLSGFLLRWSEINKAALRHELTGKVVKKGMMLVKGLFSKYDGTIESVNEFMVAKVTLEISHQRVITSPVVSEVTALTKDSLELSFRALDVPVDGIGDGKIWGNCRLKLISSLADIDFSKNGEVGFCNHLDRALLIKAEVVGMVGLVFVGEIDKNRLGTTELLLAEMSSAVFKQVASKLGDESVFRVLLNTKMGRILFVVQ